MKRVARVTVLVDNRCVAEVYGVGEFLRLNWSTPSCSEFSGQWLDNLKIQLHFEPQTPQGDYWRYLVAVTMETGPGVKHFRGQSGWLPAADICRTPVTIPNDFHQDCDGGSCVGGENSYGGVACAGGGIVEVSSC